MTFARVATEQSLPQRTKPRLSHWPSSTKTIHAKARMFSLSGVPTLSLSTACKHVTIIGKEAGAGWEVTPLERKLGL